MHSSDIIVVVRSFQNSFFRHDMAANQRPLDKIILWRTFLSLFWNYLFDSESFILVKVFLSLVLEGDQWVAVIEHICKKHLFFFHTLRRSHVSTAIMVITVAIRQEGLKYWLGYYMYSTVQKSDLWDIRNCSLEASVIIFGWKSMQMVLFGHVSVKYCGLRKDSWDKHPSISQIQKSIENKWMKFN